MKLFYKFFVALALCSSAFLSFNAQALDSSLDWPALYGTNVVPDLHIKIRTTDWATILADETFEIEVPALLWASQDGDTAQQEAYLVSIRRKSATPINGKVSFKIDINEYEDMDGRAKSKWHRVKKLSLENGDDQDVISEGLSWYLHRLATRIGVYPDGYQPGMANWATLTAHLVSDEACTGMFDLYCSGGAVTSVPQGVYVNVEQVDKQFLKNRDVWASDKTWLYKKSEIGGSPELKEAGCQESSPVVEALQCSPFIGPTGKGKHKIEPDACAASLLNDLIDMQAMLGVGAVNAFSSNPDELLNHEKNFFWADYSDSSEPVTCTSPHAQIKRTHYPWDLDSGIYDVERNVYGQATEPRKGRKGTSTTLSETSYQAVFLKDYGSDAVNFRTQYNQQLLALSGESSVEDILAFLDATELLLSELLEADPNSKITNAEEHFDYLRAWVSQRAVNVGTQVCDDDPALCSQ